MPHLEAIYLGPAKRGPMGSVDAVDVTALGLAGDRYASGVGTLSKKVEEGDAGRHVTLIQAEAIEAAMADFGEDFSGGRHRRNLVSRGLASINDLIYARLRIGRDVVLRVDRHCHPCGHLSRLTSTASTRSLKMRGGLRLTVLEPGAIRVGDSIEVLPRR
jgi:MOSC domain-containing protein YiiM